MAGDGLYELLGWISAVRARSMRNKSELERRTWRATGMAERVQGVRYRLLGQLMGEEEAASPIGRRVTISRCRNGVSAAGKDADRSGAAAVCPGCGARGQAPVVTVRAWARVASRTKRATLPARIRISPRQAALALLGKPNQGERLRPRRC